MADSISLASKQYVDDNCIVKSGTWDSQVMTGNYTVKGTLSVPTPALPPAE